MKKRRLKNSLNVIVLTIVMIGIVVLLNILLTKYSYRKDITENRIFELSESTLSVLSELDKSGKTVNVYFFALENGHLDLKTENLILGLLKQYDKSSKNLTYQTVNLEKNPSLAQKYNLTSGYEIVFEMQKRTKVVTLMEMFEGTAFNGEKVYTSAIKYVLNENPPIVYFIQGHKEAKLDSEITYLKDEIEREGFIIKTLNLALQGSIPEDASMIIDIGSKTEFSSKEIDILKEYLDNGGKMLVLASAFNEEVSIDELNKLLNNYAINLNNDISIDPYRNFIGAQNIVIPVYGTHDISRKLDEQQEYYMVIPDSRSIEIKENEENISIQTLLQTTTNSWGETSLEQYNSKEIKNDDVDNKGPLDLAVYIKKEISENKHMEIIVVGNDLLIFDSLLNSSRSGANIEFILNSMKQLNPEEQPITIEPKPLDIKQIILPYNMQKLLFFALVLGIPAIVLLTGFLIWLRRKNL